MSEQLLIRFVGNRLDKVEWIATHSASSSIVHIDSLADIIKRRPVIWIIPANKTTLTQVQLPKGRAGQIKAAVPFMLEDELASDIDDLHFTMLPRSDNNQTPIIVSDKTWMLKHLDILYANGIQPNRAIVDVLLLPHKINSWTLFEENQQIWLKQCDAQGFQCDVDLLLPLLQQWLKDTNHPAIPKINTYLQDTSSQLPTQLTELGMKIQQHDYAPSLGLMRKNVEKHKHYNMLIGLQLPGHNKTGDIKPWLPAGILFVLALLLYSATLVYRYQDIIAQDEKTAIQLTQIFKKAFPEVKRVQNELVQAQQALDAAQGESKTDQRKFLDKLYALGEGLSRNKNIRLMSFDFRKDQLSAELLAKNITALETLKQFLKTHYQLKMQIISTTNQRKSVEARILLKGSSS